jgi:hypothetical protein
VVNTGSAFLPVDQQGDPEGCCSVWHCNDRSELTGSWRGRGTTVEDPPPSNEGLAERRAYDYDNIGNRESHTGGEVTPAGGVCDEPIVLTDLFRTILAATNVASGDKEAGDGVDLSAVLKDPSARLDRDAIFFHYPHYYDTTTPVSAVRARDWKLLEYFEDGRVELYHLAADPGERTDLAGRVPDRAVELRRRLHAWRKSVNASLPQPNPARPTTQAGKP